MANISVKPHHILPLHECGRDIPSNILVLCPNHHKILDKAKVNIISETKEYLLEAVSKHLKPINYDRWSELYWKKQLENKLTHEEEKELNNIEKENLKTIKEIVEKIKNDNKIMELIEKIKSHPWVRVIEGEGK